MFESQKSKTGIAALLDMEMETPWKRGRKGPRDPVELSEGARSSFLPTLKHVIGVR